MSFHILNGGIAQQSEPNRLALEVIRYRVLGKPYHSWRAILAETGESDTLFLVSLKRLHGIEFDSLHCDPMLYCTQDTNQMRLLEESGVPNPTMLQIAMTAKAWALSEVGAMEKMDAILKAMQEPEPLTS